MSVRRALVATIAAAAIFCGGQIVVDQPLGHAADDGGYVLPDGAPAFVSGQGCEGYATSAQLTNCSDLQGCTYGLDCSAYNATDECTKKAAAILPAGYPMFANCKSNPAIDNGGYVCVFNEQIQQSSYCPHWQSQLIVATPVLACHAGPDGDAFCSAYLTQYVLGGGVASARCISACNPADDFDGLCATTTGSGGGFAFTPVGQPCGPSNDCEGLAMCVTRNGQSRCELPCMAPP